MTSFLTVTCSVVHMHQSATPNHLFPAQSIADPRYVCRESVANLIEQHNRKFEVLSSFESQETRPTSVVATAALPKLMLENSIAQSKLWKVDWKIHERWSIDLFDRSASFDLIGWIFELANQMVWRWTIVFLYLWYTRMMLEDKVIILLSVLCRESVKCGSSHVCGFSHVLLQVSRSFSFTFIDNAIFQSAVVEINRPVCGVGRSFLCVWALQFLSGSWKHFLRRTSCIPATVQCIPASRDRRLLECTTKYSCHLADQEDDIHLCQLPIGKKARLSISACKCNLTYFVSLLRPSDCCRQWPARSVRL